MFSPNYGYEVNRYGWRRAETHFRLSERSLGDDLQRVEGWLAELCRSYSDSKFLSSIPSHGYEGEEFVTLSSYRK